MDRIKQVIAAPLKLRTVRARSHLLLVIVWPVLIGCKCINSTRRFQSTQVLSQSVDSESLFKIELAALLYQRVWPTAAGRPPVHRLSYSKAKRIGQPIVYLIVGRHTLARLCQ